MSSNLEDLHKFDKKNSQYIVKQMNLLYYKGFDFCRHLCKLRFNPGEMAACEDNWYKNYTLPRKYALHVGQDKEEYFFKKCLAEQGSDEIDLDTIFACTHKVHNDKMIVTADYIGDKWKEILNNVH